MSHPSRAGTVVVEKVDVAKAGSNAAGQAADRLEIRRRRDWWSQAGSNCRPSACKADALPTELHPQGENIDTLFYLKNIKISILNLSEEKKKITYREQSKAIPYRKKSNAEP